MRTNKSNTHLSMTTTTKTLTPKHKIRNEARDEEGGKIEVPLSSFLFLSFEMSSFFVGLPENKK